MDQMLIFGPIGPKHNSPYFRFLKKKEREEREKKKKREGMEIGEAGSGVFRWLWRRIKGVGAEQDLAGKSFPRYERYRLIN